MFRCFRTVLASQFRFQISCPAALAAVALAAAIAGCGEPLMPDPPPEPAEPSVGASVAAGPVHATLSADAAKLPSVKEAIETLTKPGCAIHSRTLSDLYAEYRVELEFSPAALEASGRSRILLYGVNVTLKRPDGDGGVETLPKGLGLRIVCRIPDTTLGESEGQAWIEAFLREKGIDVAAAPAGGSAARGPVARAARLAWSGVREVWRRLAPRPLSAAQSTTYTEFDCDTWAETGDAGISCTRIEITVTCPFGYDYELSSERCVGGGISLPPISVFVSYPGVPIGGTAEPNADDDDEEEDEVLEGCGDERDTMLAEYGEYGVTGGPSSCDDFVGSGGGANFSWSELNGGFTNGNPHSTWGLDAVNSTLLPRLQTTRANYGNQPIRVTSGYRCPHGNASIPKAHAQSNHMHGIAADIYGASPWSEAEFNKLKDAAEDAGGAPMKLEDGSDMTYYTYDDHHLHINY